MPFVYNMPFFSILICMIGGIVTPFFRNRAFNTNCKYLHHCCSFCNVIDVIHFIAYCGRQLYVYDGTLPGTVG